MHRFSLVRLIKGPTLSRKQRQTERSRQLWPVDVQRVVGVVWESLDYVCAERPTPALLSTAQHLSHFGELGAITLKPALEAQLSNVSPFPALGPPCSLAGNRCIHASKMLYLRHPVVSKQACICLVILRMVYLLLFMRR